MRFVEYWEDKRKNSPANKDNNRHSETEDYPFELLALQWTGYTPIAVELDDHKDRSLSDKNEIAKRGSGGIQCAKGMWEEDGRDLPEEEHDQGPALEVRHQPSRGQ